MLEPIEESLGAPAVGIFVRVDHLETDLSLFQLVKDDEYQRLVAALGRQTKALVHQFGRSRKAFALSQKRSGGLGVLLSGAGAPALMSPTGPWGALLAGLGAGGKAAMVHALRFGDSALVAREQRVRWQLDNYVERVGGSKAAARRLRL